MMSALSRYLAAVFCVASLVSCASGIKPYPPRSPLNLEIHNHAEQVEASLHLYRLDQSCAAEYLGSVDLDAPQKNIGIEPAQTTLLEVGFASSSFWSNRSAYMNYPLTLKARSSKRYELNIYYRDGIYDVRLFEIDPATGQKRRPDDGELRTCL